MSTKEKALKLPQKPGVYIMLDKSGAVIYVGKAKKLYNRVNSYFRNNSAHNAKTRLMVSQVKDFDYIITDTEFEALVLENSLIKRHMPKYNILLKDDKGYPFIRLSVKDEYPRFSIVSKTADDGARYFGPYGGRVESRRVINAVSELLRLPTCNRKFPADIGRGRPCLNSHIGKCDAVCAGNITKEEYNERILRACMVLSGKSDELEAVLEKRMTEHAERLEFELAGKVRDELRAIRALSTKQKIISGMMSDTDVLALHAGESKTVFSILHYIDGVLLDSESKTIETPVFADESELLESFAIRYYSDRSRLPSEIYLQYETEYSSLMEDWLTEKGGRRVRVITPKRGDKLKSVKMAQQNAKEKAEAAMNREERTARVLTDLKKILALDDLPQRIEAYDISHTSGSETVAAMTVFKNGVPLKREYRKFKISELCVQDDPGAMREVIERRIKRYTDGDDKFEELPDLILLDGGIAQLRAVVPVIEKAGLEIPVFGMVKDDRHKTRAIINEKGMEIGISSSPSVFRFVSAIQEEVHRFVIEYHRKRRGHSMTESELKKIAGVGEKRASLLLANFKSIRGIKNATQKELSEVVPASVAALVYKHYHGKER